MLTALCHKRYICRILTSKYVGSIVLKGITQVMHWTRAIARKTSDTDSGTTIQQTGAKAIVRFQEIYGSIRQNHRLPRTQCSELNGQTKFILKSVSYIATSDHVIVDISGANPYNT